MTKFKEEANEARKDNIIDMGLTFSAMLRLFSSGSKSDIVNLLNVYLNKIQRINSQEDYSTMHKEFCEEFSIKITTALKKLKNGKTKESRQASFGQAAKIFDIVIKVYVHYSNLPDINVANKVKPFLNGPIDNPIMDYLKEKYNESKLSAVTIEAIDEEQYNLLQNLVRKDIKERFGNQIIPVEFDDIIWKEKNRPTAKQV